MDPFHDLNPPGVCAKYAEDENAHEQILKKLENERARERRRRRFGH